MQKILSSLLISLLLILPACGPKKIALSNKNAAKNQTLAEYLEKSESKSEFKDSKDGVDVDVKVLGSKQIAKIFNSGIRAGLEKHSELVYFNLKNNSEKEIEFDMNSISGIKFLDSELAKDLISAKTSKWLKIGLGACCAVGLCALFVPVIPVGVLGIVTMGMAPASFLGAGLVGFYFVLGCFAFFAGIPALVVAPTAVVATKMYNNDQEYLVRNLVAEENIKTGKFKIKPGKELGLILLAKKAKNFTFDVKSEEVKTQFDVKIKK